MWVYFMIKEIVQGRTRRGAGPPAPSLSNTLNLTLKPLLKSFNQYCLPCKYTFDIIIYNMDPSYENNDIFEVKFPSLIFTP